MSHPLSRSLLAAAIGASLWAASPAFADEAASAVAVAGEGEAMAPDVPGSRERVTMGARVEVTAKGTADDWPDALATEVIGYEDAVAAPADFQDLITRIPGVGSTGQNGAFETFSIRGSGANNILILFGSMPLTTQRRAGIPVSFVEPLLLGDISVTRGPSVVHYGPGALGGAISVEPRWFDAPFATAGYATGGDEWVAGGGFGNESFSIAAARHGADDTEAANGTPLHTQYDRGSAVLQYRTTRGDIDFDAMLAPSRTEDIGKSNSRFPTRNTIYPYDRHTLGRVRLRHANGFEASLQGHDQALVTWNRRPNFPDTFADVRSLDIGATIQQTIQSGDFSNNFGLEYFGRRNVDAFDASGSLADRDYTLQGARESGWSLFGITDWSVTPTLDLELGGRYSSIKQEESGAEPDDSDVGFTAGAVWRPSDPHRFSFNLASGYRFPSLEERFFSGVTAQGEVIGNPNLNSEHSLGFDIGHAWVGETWRTEVHVWRTDVDDLIQLTAIAPDINGFGNVTEAKLHGAEATLGWTPIDAFALRASAALVRSKDEGTGDPLYGSPPLTTELEARWNFADTFSVGARYMHRFEVDRPGFEEVERDSVDVVDANLNWRPRESLSLQFYVRNLFDEDYFATADALSAFAPERSIGVNATWMLH